MINFEMDFASSCKLEFDISMVELCILYGQFQFDLVTVWFRCATSDLSLIQFQS